MIRYKFWVKSYGYEWTGTMLAFDSKHVFQSLRSGITGMPIFAAVILIMKDRQ